MAAKPPTIPYATDEELIAQALPGLDAKPAGERIRALMDLRLRLATERHRS